MRTKKYSSLLLLVMLILFCKETVAQSNDTALYKTPEINVYSNKIITDRFNSPANIQIFDRKKIENKNGENLSDILQLSGSVFIKSYGGNSSLSTISMNGLGSEHTLILLDGFKLNSTQNAQVDLSTISKENIESIEVLNNGSSSLYGSEAIGGVINIVTKKNVDDDFILQLNGQMGSYRQKKIYLNTGKRIKKFSFNFNFSKETSINNFDYYYDSGLDKILKQRENSNYDILNYSVNLDYFNSRESKINYFSSYSKIFRSIPGVESGSAPSQSSQNDNTWNNILSFERFFSKGIFLKTQINYQNILSKYNDRYTIDSYYKNLYLSNTSQLSVTKENFEIVSGYELSVATLRSNELESNVKRIQTGLFVVSEVAINPILRFFPSLRHDYVSDIDKNVFSGKLGLNVKPFENYRLNFKSSVGNNFASPTFNELYWNQLGNKQLKPERSVNFDAGAIVGFDLFLNNTLEIIYTYIDARDKIVWSPNYGGLWSPKNIGRSISNVVMVNLSFNKELKENLRLNLDFKYSHTRSLKKSLDFPGDPSYNKQIFYIPSDVAKCLLSVEYKTSGLNLFYNLIGKRYTDFENINFLPAIDYFEGNIYQTFKINKTRLQLKLEVNNIFNSDYQIISGYPMPLRNYKVILNIEY